MKRLLIALIGLSTSFANTINESAFALAKTYENENSYLFAPVSINTCMHMVYLGAAGNTKEAFDTARYQSFEYTPPSDVHIANGMWVDTSFWILPEYSAKIQTIHSAQIESMFTANPPYAIEKINTWIKTETNGMIENLLSNDDLDENTKVVLANATYFKGSWQFPFREEATKMQPFYPENRNVPMMHQTRHFTYFGDNEGQFISLPFKESSIAIFIYLPKEDEAVTLDRLNSMLHHSSKRRVSLYLPRFSAKCKSPLAEKLKELGLGEAFSNRADFSNIDGRGVLSLSTVSHEACFDCDEYGVTAAAATSASFNVTSAAPQEPLITFRADHPFTYFLIDTKDNTILFMGRYSGGLQ